MEKLEIENRRNAIKNIMKAAIEGEKIKQMLETKMKRKGLLHPDFPEPNSGWGGEEYDQEELDSFYEIETSIEDFLSEQKEYREISSFTDDIKSKIYSEGMTLEDLGEYIRTISANAVDISDIYLGDCKKTENDKENANSLGDEDIIAYFDEKYDFSYEDPWPQDVAATVLEKGMSIDQLPEKLLFNLSFIGEYIKQSSRTIAREKEDKGITPQDIEGASSSIKLEDFRDATNTIKETAKGEQEISTDDKSIDD